MTDADDADEIELVDSMRSIAHAARTMYNSLLAEGFNPTEALTLVRSWIHGMAGGHA